MKYLKQLEDLSTPECVLFCTICAVVEIVFGLLIALLNPIVAFCLIVPIIIGTIIFWIQIDDL